jgi:cytoskeleton protein RodZ
VASVHSVPVQVIGIGPALARARSERGKSIDEASRETHIRADYLSALERERFDQMLGDVYVRGFLRSYANYLGLDADKVLKVYNAHFGTPQPVLPDPSPAARTSSPHPHLPAAVRHHPSWSFLIGVAAIVLAVLGAAGLLSRSNNSPRSESLSQAQASLPFAPARVTVALAAAKEVRVTVTIGTATPVTVTLRAGEGRSFTGEGSISVRLDRGGVTRIAVNGHDLGKPGRRGAPFSATYRAADYPALPSPTAPSVGASPSKGSKRVQGASPSPSG